MPNRITPTFHATWALVGALIAIMAACSKPTQPGGAIAQQARIAAAAAAESQPAEPTPSPPVKPTEGNVTSTSSEHIATGAPQEPAAKYRSADALSSAPVYFGNPDMKLDEHTLNDVRKVLDETCGLLAEGVELLEKYRKEPEKAAKALRDHHAKQVTRIERVFRRAADVKARLKAAGYDQDIPAEVRPAVDACMTPLFARLETVRSVYVGHNDVLQEFGKLFPRRL